MSDLATEGDAMATGPDTEPADLTTREFYDAALNFQAKALEQSSTYNQVIILAGYAAFFAVWSTMADEVPRWAMLLSGASIIVSVIVYVGWTIAGMVFMKTFHEDMAKAIGLGPEGFLARVQSAESRMLARRPKLMRWWAPVVIISGGLGLVAASVLSGTAICALLGSGLPMLP